MFKTTSLRKTFVYLENNTLNDNLYVIVRIGNHTYHCKVFQALNYICESPNDFKWMQVV